jgi:hypothetical protein
LSLSIRAVLIFHPRLAKIDSIVSSAPNTTGFFGETEKFWALAYLFL